MNSNTQARIYSMLVQLYDLEKEELSRDISFSDDLQLSPAELTDFFAAIEKEFNISTSTDEIQDVTTIGALIDFVEDALEGLT